MFHWICPECGREIAPTAKECPACDQVASAAEITVAAVAPVPLEAAPLTPEVVTPQVLPPEVVTPEIVTPRLELSIPAAPAELEPTAPTLELAAAVADPEPPVSARIELPVPAVASAPALAEAAKPLQYEVPLLPAPAAPVTFLAAPAPAELEPKIQTRLEAPAPPAPVSAQPRLVTPAHEPEALPGEQALLPQTAATLPVIEPREAEAVPAAALRDPQPQAPRVACTDLTVPAEQPFLPSRAPMIPAPQGSFTAQPTQPGFLKNSSLSVASIRPAVGNLALAGTDPQANLSVPGPVLPHELTSLDAAGIARMLRANPAAQASSKRGWLVSAAVASGFLAIAMAAVFYAMPTLAEPSSANSKVEPKPAPVTAAVPEPAPAPARKSPRELEVTGVRFVTDLPDRGPQIHYIVVNHSNAPLNGVVVNVTLRATASQSPLSQFSFRTPRLGPYESKEMFSAIERLNRPMDLPDWREVDTEVEISK